MKRTESFLALLCCWLIPATAWGGQLLSGTIATGSDEALSFSLSGESRENVVGGEIRLGRRAFEIERVSRLGLIGAARYAAHEDAAQSTAEFVIFSSSFSEQTAVGQPWVAARTYLGCDEAYNSLLALYRLSGEEAVKALGPAPYPRIAEEVDATDDSVVYCFNSRRPPSETESE